MKLSGTGGRGSDRAALPDNSEMSAFQTELLGKG